jgi:hypothetical protein
VDVLSEVLKVVRLEGALFFNAEFSAPWRISSSPSASFAPYLCPGAERLMMYHFVTEGRAYLEIQPDGERFELSAGDVVMMPGGDAHYLGNGPAVPPVDGLRAMSRILPEGLKLLRFGSGGETTRFVCGYLACEPRLCDVILAALPRVLKVELAKHPSGQWLEHAIRFAVGTEGRLCGRRADRVEALRAALPRNPALLYQRTPAKPDGVARRRAGSDHRPGARLAPQGPSGTVDHRGTRAAIRNLPLAACGALSISAWRLANGVSGELALETRVGVADLERGYRGTGSRLSRLWFGVNRAFKREFGCPPAQFRRDRRSRVGIATAASV